MKKSTLLLSVLVFITAISNLNAKVVFGEDMELKPNAYLTKLKDKDTSLSPDDFMIAALIASGAKSEEINGYMQKVNKLYKEYEEYRVTKNTKLNDAEAGILFLYDMKWLKEYQTGQTYVTTLLDTGYYNCVSSAIVFMYMMKRKGYKVIANETPTHVFCTVMSASGKQTDVETTNAFGYAPGVRKSVNSESGSNYTSYVDKTDYEDRQRITGRRLISTIYHNRLVTEREKPDSQVDLEYVVQLLIDSTEIQNETKQALQDMYSTMGGFVIYNLYERNEYMNILYLSKAVNDKYGHFGKSKIMMQNTAAAYQRAYNKKPSDTDYTNALFAKYGECLSTENHDYYYALGIYNTAVKLYNSGEIKKAKELIQKGMETLPDNKKLSDFYNSYLK